MSENNFTSNDLTKSDISNLSQVIDSVDFKRQLNIIKAISNENRLKIVYLLNLKDELCVHDIAKAIDITVANASYHLQTLLKEDIVQNRRDGKHLFYSLKCETAKSLLDFLHFHKN